MKSYEEMADDVFRRMGEYERLQKRRRKWITGTVTSLCCVCLIVLLGFGQGQGQDPNLTPTNTPDQTSHTGIDETVDVSNGELPGDPAIKDEIVVQRIDVISSPMIANICLLGDDFDSMTSAELNFYYGINVFPKVPEDLKEEGQVYGIYRREKGAGAIYWDSNSIVYANGDQSRTVDVSVDKDMIPFDFCNLFDEIGSRSIVSNTEVGIAQTPNGEYYAEFLYRGVGFRIVSTGLSQEELIGVIRSIIV